MNGIQLQKLPVEILVEIADNLPRQSVMDLSLASRLFNGVAVRILYRTLFLRGVSITRKCLETLSSNKNSASHVKSLSIYLHTSSIRVDDAILKAIKNVAPSLESLTLVWGGFLYAPLSKVSFSRLTVLHASQDLDDDLAGFLEVNPQLETITLSGRGVRLSRKLQLPFLNSYAGPCQGIPLLLADAKVDTLKVACICDPPCEKAFLETVAAAPKRLAFSNFPYESPVSIFSLVKTKFAHLSSLELRSVKSSDWSLGGVLYECFIQILPHLHCLERLDTGKVGYPRGGLFQQLEQSFGWLSTLTAVQDSLCVVIAGDLRWGRLRLRSAWAPVVDDVAVLEWMLHSSSMLTRLRRAVGSATNAQTARQVIACEINRAFGFDRRDETLRVPVRSTQGRELNPYTDRDPLPSLEISPSALWDSLLLAIGRLSVLSMDGSGADDEERPIDETHREMFRFVLDAVWASIHGEGVDMARYLQNPEYEWDDTALYFSYPSLSNTSVKNKAKHLYLPSDYAAPNY